MSIFKQWKLRSRYLVRCIRLQAWSLLYMRSEEQLSEWVAKRNTIEEVQCAGLLRWVASRCRIDCHSWLWIYETVSMFTSKCTEHAIQTGFQMFHDNWSRKEKFLLESWPQSWRVSQSPCHLLESHGCKGPHVDDWIQLICLTYLTVLPKVYKKCLTTRGFFSKRE